MGDWNLFFATTAGSAATLVGLLFVATQLHLGVFSDPKNRWAALAQSTLTILATAFALSLSFLIPMLSIQVRGQISLAVAVFSIYRGIRVWWPVFRREDRDRRHMFVQSFWLLLLPFAVYVYLISGAVGLLRGDATAIVNIGGAVLSMFIVALRNTWRLVVNVEQDEPSVSSKDSPKPNAQDGVVRPDNSRRDMKKRVECECGWVLETDDEEKLVKGVQDHASEVHHMQGVTRDQVLAQAKPA